jgi:hypothetical protein
MSIFADLTGAGDDDLLELGDPLGSEFKSTCCATSFTDDDEGLSLRRCMDLPRSSRCTLGSGELDPDLETDIIHPCFINNYFIINQHCFH